MQDLSASLKAALGSARHMPKHFCELDLHVLGLRCCFDPASAAPISHECFANCSYLDRVEALSALTNAVLWHPER